MRLLISGYGGKNGDTAGVYDTNERHPLWESGIPSVSYMCADKAKGILFGAGEYPDYGKLYLFLPEAGGYRLADTLDIPGGALCHIAWSARFQILTGACYQNGDIFAVSVEGGKSFGKMLTYARQGEGTAELSRAHCTVFNADESLVFSANIALDRVYVYMVSETGLTKPDMIQLPKGAGPRHILPIGDLLYVITEYSNEIITLARDSGGLYQLDGRVSTLPAGFTGKSFCSAMAFWPGALSAGTDDGAGFLYAANRGANTIAVFKRGKGGAITKIYDCGCAGDWPRHIALAGGDDRPMLAVANERSGQISLRPIRLENGALENEIRHIPFQGASYVHCLMD